MRFDTEAIRLSLVAGIAISIACNQALGSQHHPTGPAARNESGSEIQLLRYCRTFYEGDGGTERARRALARIPPAALKSRLETVINRSYPQSYAYASAAYALAYSGIDVKKNTRRMLYCVDIHHWKMPEGYQRPHEDLGSYDPADKAYIKLYRRYRVNEFRFIMEAETDGALGEAVDEMLARLLLTFPKDMLRTAARTPDVARPIDSTRTEFRHQTGIERLAEAARSINTDGKITKLLQRYRQDEDPVVRLAAKRLSKGLNLAKR
jgi:hypothetical protein